MQETFGAANPDATGKDSKPDKVLVTCENVRFVYAREYSQLLLLPWVERR
jgi:hypothetical protein